MLFNYLYFDPKTDDLPLAIQNDKILKIDILSRDPMLKTIKETFFDQYTKNPFFYFSGTHDIPQLDLFMKYEKYSNIIKNKNIDFFFFEPLTHYIPSLALNYRPHILKSNNSLYDRSTIRAYELDSISKWVDEHGIKNLTVYCTDYKSDEYYKGVYENLNLKFMDVFAISIFNNYTISKKRYEQYGIVEKEDVYSSNLITKKFIAPAWRYDPSRHFVMAFLAEKGLLENNNVSFLYNVDQKEMMRSMWFNWNEFKFKHLEFSNIILSGNEKLRKMVPLTLDVDNPTVIYSSSGHSPSGANIVSDHNVVGRYKESFLSIVMESRATQPWPNISEKTINAISNERPFVIVGAPGVLKMLKEMGFKTFDKYWDESYDDIELHDDRMLAVCNLIEDICKYNIEEMRDMHKDMAPILLHNKMQIRKINDFYKNCQ